MQVVRGKLDRAASERRGPTFTGTVWADPILAADSITINHVFFEPGARTHWHRHELAQILLVTGGSGVLANEEGTAAPLRAGDVAYIPQGEVHWHGATPDSYLIHIAISIGRTEWLTPVAEADYLRASYEGSPSGSP